MNEQAVLVLERFCGRETHPIVSDTWSIFHDDAIEMPTLCIQIQAGAGIDQDFCRDAASARPNDHAFDVVEP